ncbi:hypothetical protein WG908_00305 [Sphingobium sp. AN641]|uniref:hypothetical protein n=1 Tax=Sphingobium sp. AN641 TaxID=3133443 RepID=UPI0030BA9081
MAISRRWALVALLGAASPASGNTQAGIAIDTHMFVERVTTDVNGRARRILMEADRAERGDSLVFVVNWRHAGAQPVSGIALTNIVPGRVLIEPADEAMLVSVDGGVRWGRLDQLWMPTQLGGTRRAMAEDVTHVRWTMPGRIAPGQSGRMSYRGTAR